MKIIQLTRGASVIVDDADYATVSCYKWYLAETLKVSYAARRGRKGEPKCVLMHRALIGLSTAGHVDHINHNGLDNRRENLRACSASQNIGNSRLGRRNKSGFKGVSWNAEKNRFHAQIKENRKTRHLGFYKTAIEASEAYKKAASVAFF